MPFCGDDSHTSTKQGKLAVVRNAISANCSRKNCNGRGYDRASLVFVLIVVVLLAVRRPACPRSRPSETGDWQQSTRLAITQSLTRNHSQKQESG